MTKALRGFASTLGLALSVVALGVLSSCGGGGASVNPDLGGPMQIFPEEGTFYAGVPSVITLAGSVPPYSVTSSDPTTLPVPNTTNANKLVVIPNNPGVVDTGLAPNALPIRTVNVTVRGQNATQAVSTIHVAQNFLVSYNAVITSPTCPAAAGTTVAACAGQPGLVTLLAVVNGVLQAGKQFKFCNVIGDFQFYDLPTNTFQQCITVTADAQGKVIAPFRTLASAPTQIAIFRVSDAANPNVFQDTPFTIIGAGTGTPATLVAIPATITLTGRNANECGTGSADVFIFDGQTPYQGVSTDPNIVVTGSDPLPPQNGGTAPPATSSTQPGRFTVTVNNPNACLTTGKPVIFTDQSGGRVVVTVTTIRGTSPPVSALVVAPTSITLICGGQGNVSVAGGNGNYVANSSDIRAVSAFAVANTLSITRNNGDGATLHPTPATVSVTDGSSVATVQVNIPTNCP